MDPLSKLHNSMESGDKLASAKQSNTFKNILRKNDSAASSNKSKKAKDYLASYTASLAKPSIPKPEKILPPSGKLKLKDWCLQMFNLEKQTQHGNLTELTNKIHAMTSNVKSGLEKTIKKHAENHK